MQAKKIIMNLLKELDEVIASEHESAEEIRKNEKDNEWAENRHKDAEDLQKVRDLMAEHKYGEAQRYFYHLDTFVRDAMPLPLLRVLQTAKICNIETHEKTVEQVWCSYRTEEINEEIEELKERLEILEKEKQTLTLKKGQ